MSPLLRRFAACVLQIAVISTLTFFVFQIAPGDFYSEERLNPQVSAQALERMRAERGLQDSWIVRYARWISSCVKGEFGTSAAYGIPVSRLIAPRLARSAALIGSAWILGWLIALAAAIWTASRGSKWQLNIAEPSMTVAGMLPEVIVVSILLWLAVAWGVPLSGAWLPFTAITLGVVPVVFLHSAGALARARQMEFVRLAESREIAPARLWWRFIAPAAANPLLSLLGPSLVASTGSALVVEAMAGWPGLGPLFVEAVQARDYELVQAVVLLLGVTLTLVNLAADLILYRMDPRIRLQDDRAS